jgi:hypothetical protein
MKFLGKKHKYKVIVELKKNEVVTFIVKSFSIQEAKYKVIQEQGCLYKDIISVIPTR